MRFAALLRGVNLGKRSVGMADLRDLLEGEGMEEVTTYLRSGNAVFTTASRDRRQVREQIETAMATEFGFDVPTLLVTGPEIAGVIEACPYREQAEVDPTKVHVTFVEPMPPADRLAEVDLPAVAPEHFTVGDGVIYMHLPNGMGRASLPGILAKETSKVIATTRNWRTVVALSEMLDQ